MAQKTGTIARKAVLMGLANCHNGHTGRCFPKIERLARELDCSERTVNRALVDLEEQGLIKRQQTRNGERQGPNEYTLALDNLSPQGDNLSSLQSDRMSHIEPEVDLEPEVNLSDPNGSGASAPDTAQTLVAEVVDSAKKHQIPLARRTIGHFAKEIHSLLNEGFDPDTIRAGLQRMAQKGKLQPALLAGFASETRLPTSQPLRYGRGLTTAQILELGRSMNGDTGTGG